MKLTTLLTATLLLLVASGRALAEGSAGASSFDFLMLDANARAVGLGGAYTSLACDANALNYNPAGLGCVKRNEATFMHNQYAEGIGQEYLGLALKQGFGAQLNYLRFGSITRTTYSSPDGNLGDFNVTDTAFGVGYGKQVREAFRLGGAIKILRESNDGTSATGYAADLGAIATLANWEGVQFGAALQNLGPSVRYGSTSEKLPRIIRLGSSYSRSIGLVSFDITKEGSDKLRFALGAEVEPITMLLLRLGFNTKSDTGAGIAVGVGWKGQNFSVDYALSLLGDLGMANRMSVTYRWGDVVAPPSFEPREYKPRNRYSAPSISGDRLSKNEVDMLILKARKLVAARKYVPAQDILKEVDNSLVEMDLRRADYLEILGRVNFELGKVEQARQYYSESLNIGMGLGIVGREAAKSYEGMGRCLQAQGDKAGALEYYSKAYELERTPERKIQVESLQKQLEDSLR